MQLSFLSYLFRRFPLEYSFAAAGRYGFDGVEIWGARPHAYPPDLDAGEIADIRRAARENRVRISAYTPELLAYPYNLVSPLEKEREETQRYLARALEIAAELEAERVLFTLPHPGYAARREKVLAEAVQRLKQLRKDRRPRQIAADVQHMRAHDFFLPLSRSRLRNPGSAAIPHREPNPYAKWKAG